MIDLRSDTVTKPSPAMRRAMAEAEVGDDVYGEDPTVNALQEKAAQMLGKEAGLFMPSGSMANLCSVLAHTRPGDSIVIGEHAHPYLYEAGGIGAVAGVVTYIAGTGGIFTWEEALAACKGGTVHFPPTTLIMVENTHNTAGGIVFPQAELKRIGEGARYLGIPLHMDGARIFNAAVAQGIEAKEIAAAVDSLSFCLSKGLGCPVGSVVLGSREFIKRVHRYRKMVGGAMRQAGILAAAGLYALEHNIARLVEDHENARLLAEMLVEEEGFDIDMATVQTNMVFFNIIRPGLDAFTYAARLKEKGVLVNALGQKRIRAVTHLDVNREMVEKAGRIMIETIRE